MASHMEIRPADDSLALALASAAYAKAGSHSTCLTGTIAVDNGDGTQTWLGGGVAEPMPGVGGLIPFVGDTTPPGRPIGVSATSSLEVACARWDGELEGGIPADFDHVELFAKPDSTGKTIDLGALRGRGEITTGILPVGDVVEIWAVAYDCAHDADGLPAPNASEESDHATIIIAPVVSQKDLADSASEILAAAKTDTDTQVGKVSDDLAQARKDIDANAKTFTGTARGATIIGSEFRDSEDPSSAHIKFNASGMYLGTGLAYSVSTGVLSIKGAVQSGGSISGATVTGAIVQTTSDANRGVKLTSGGLIGYDQAGNAKFTLKTDGSVKMDGPVMTNGRITAPILEGGTITGGTITGTKIQSSTSDKVGFKLTGGALDFWDDQGENTVHLNGKANMLAGSFATALSGPRLEMRNTTTDDGSVYGLLECHDSKAVAWYVQGQSHGFNTDQPDPGAYRRLNIGINPDNSELSVVRYNSGASRVVMEAGRVDVNGSDGWAQQVGGLGVYVNNVRIDPVIYTDLNDWFVPAAGWTAYAGDSGKDNRSHMTVVGNTCYMQLELQRADRKSVTFQSGDYCDIGYFKTEFIPKIGLNVPCIFNNGQYGGAFVPGNTNPSNTTGINGDGNYLRGHLRVGMRQTSDAWWVSIFMMYTL